MRKFRCFAFALVLALPTTRAESTPKSTSTPPQSLILLSWKGNDGQWNFDVTPGSGEHFKRMSRSQLEEFCASLAGLHRETSSYTLARAKKLLAIYSGNTRELYWMGFPHFRSYYANLVQYPPAEIVQQIRSEAAKHHIKLFFKRAG